MALSISRKHMGGEIHSSTGDVGEGELGPLGVEAVPHL
jgi:hypothetical protein